MYAHDWLFYLKGTLKYDIVADADTDANEMPGAYVLFFRNKCHGCALHDIAGTVGS